MFARKDLVTFVLGAVALSWAYGQSDVQSVATPDVPVPTSDAERFAEGRVALDKFKDCTRALKALDSVTPEGREDPMWVFYMAKTYECLSNFPSAIQYYKKYDALVPGQPAILEKLAELRYLYGKTQDDLQKKRAEEERLTALRRNWVGLWRNSEGDRFKIEADGSPGWVKAQVEDAEPDDDHPVFKGPVGSELDRSNHIVFRLSGPGWVDFDKESLAKCPKLKKWQRVHVKVTMSDDGKTLSVTAGTVRVSYDDCIVKPDSPENYTWKRD